MLHKLIGTISHLACVAHRKLTTGHRRPKSSMPVVLPVAGSQQELLQMNAAAVTEADGLRLRFAAMTPEGWLRLHGGVYTGMLIQQTAEEVVRLSAVCDRLFLVDLRHPVCKLKRAAARLQEGRYRSAAKHLRHAQSMMSRTRACVNGTAACDHLLQVTAAHREKALLN